MAAMNKIAIGAAFSLAVMVPRNNTATTEQIRSAHKVHSEMADVQHATMIDDAR